ncbi:unnamed protein product [Auanema sp. JU1783]|nr:unnamed protein product [Auanema sp. JU1783]
MIPSETYTIILDFIVDGLDCLRANFNRKCSTLESWQLVLYSISFSLFISWIFKVSASDDNFLQRFRRLSYFMLRSLPWVKRRHQSDLSKLREEVEEEIHQWDKIRDFYKFLPERPLNSEDIITEARQYASMGERRYMEHYDPKTKNEDLKLSSQVYELFSHSDPHRSDAFPGNRKMESEILRMCCSMFHGGTESCGVVAGGGTESTLLACLAYRNRAYSLGIDRPEIVAPITAHASLEKAVSLFGMKVHRVPVLESDKVDAECLKKYINRNTCMIVASAPNHITGTIDPIENLAEIAQAFGIPLHVDATLGGFIIPFMEYCDLNNKTIDFRLPGVTSISVDLHRYGQCPRSCSVLMYRNNSYIRYQFFSNPFWAGGLYATPTLAGGRDGGAVASAWATMLKKGRSGYMDACVRVVEGTHTLCELLLAIEGVEVKGSADVCVVAFTCDGVNIHALVDRMTRKGWHVDALVSPSAARVPITLSMCEDGVLDAFVNDVNSSISFLRENPNWVKSSKLASFYHMLKNVTDKAILNELALLRLESHYSLPSSLERRPQKTLSVEGRKMSMITTTETMRQLQELRARHAATKLEESK